jgi:hypothetical protein
MSAKIKGQSSITNERERNFVQKYIDDPYNYTAFFDITTDDMIKNLTDALWPFIPENQRHLVKIDSE